MGARPKAVGRVLHRVGTQEGRHENGRTSHANDVAEGNPHAEPAKALPYCRTAGKVSLAPFDPKSAHVLSEILGIGFRAYPRNLLNGIVFGSLAAWFLRDTLPQPFLAVWLLCLVALNLVRYSVARNFLRAPPPLGAMPEWARRASVGQGLSGLAWGLLGAAVIYVSPQSIEAVLIIFFTISLFVTFNAARPGTSRRSRSAA